MRESKIKFCLVRGHTQKTYKAAKQGAFFFYIKMCYFFIFSQQIFYMGLGKYCQI